MSADMPHIDHADDRCFTCQLDGAVRDGTATPLECARWTLWGCTCSPEAAAAANAYMRRVTE